MSNKNQFVDRTPFIRDAGFVTTVDGECASACFQREDVDRLPTPDNIRKYRKSEKEFPGRKQIHYGIYDDPKDYEEYLHGVKTLDSDHVNDCIKGRNLSGINYFVNSIKESKYAKNQREPLGKSIIRNYEFPEKYKENEFRFGIPTSGCN